jgi:hypothetical protein
MIKYLLVGIGCITYTSVVCAVTVYFSKKNVNELATTKVASEPVVASELKLPAANTSVVDVNLEIVTHAKTTLEYQHLLMYKKIFDIYIHEQLKLLELKSMHDIHSIKLHYSGYSWLALVKKSKSTGLTKQEKTD